VEVGRSGLKLPLGKSAETLFEKLKQKGLGARPCIQTQYSEEGGEERRGERREEKDEESLTLSE
jgi:hypothetical protein